MGIRIPNARTPAILRRPPLQRVAAVTKPFVLQKQVTSVGTSSSTIVQPIVASPTTAAAPAKGQILKLVKTSQGMAVQTLPKVTVVSGGGAGAGGRGANVIGNSGGVGGVGGVSAATAGGAGGAVSKTPIVSNVVKIVSSMDKFVLKNTLTAGAGGVAVGGVGGVGGATVARGGSSGKQQIVIANQRNVVRPHQQFIVVSSGGGGIRPIGSTPLVATNSTVGTLGVPSSSTLLTTKQLQRPITITMAGGGKQAQVLQMATPKGGTVGATSLQLDQGKAITVQLPKTMTIVSSSGTSQPQERIQG